MTTVELADDKLRVYTAAVEFAATADAIVARLPRRRARLGQLLRRSATSIVVNIAEGAREATARRYRRSLRVANESAAIIAVCGADGATRLALEGIIAMLTALIAKLEEHG